MNFDNRHFVILILIIIVIIFIYNYDVYIIEKNKPLCEPVFITKREIPQEIIDNEINDIELNAMKETFNNIEQFDNTNNLDNSIIEPPRSLINYNVPNINNKHKQQVITSVIKVLSFIPTNHDENEIKELIEYFSIMYETAKNLETFYKNLNKSMMINKYPYNTKYSHLILFLIGKFDNDYSNCTLKDKCNNNIFSNSYKKNNKVTSETCNKMEETEMKELETEMEDMQDMEIEQMLTEPEKISNNNKNNQKKKNNQKQYLNNNKPQLNGTDLKKYKDKVDQMRLNEYLKNNNTEELKEYRQHLINLNKNPDEVLLKNINNLDNNKNLNNYIADKISQENYSQNPQKCLNNCEKDCDNYYDNILNSNETFGNLDSFNNNNYYNYASF
jgi:hypothetical protein